MRGFALIVVSACLTGVAKIQVSYCTTGLHLVVFDSSDTGFNGTEANYLTGTL